MHRLLEIGFEVAGCWNLDGDRLLLELSQYHKQTNVLYAFVCDGDVKYVGKTTRTLQQRMAGYRKPGSTQSTNIHNHRKIKEQLARGAAVDIFALPDNGFLHYESFHVNPAAGLEDDIFRRSRHCGLRLGTAAMGWGRRESDPGKIRNGNMCGG